MADAVSNKTIFSGNIRHVVHLTNLSDGTGESGVVKVDKSALVSLNGSEPNDLVVEKIEGTVSGMSVTLAWDHTADVTIAVLGDNHDFCWKKSGGLVDTGTGGTGDIILTTNGHTAGDSYDITLHLRLRS